MAPLLLGGLLVSVIGIVVSTVMDGNSLGPLLGPSSALLVLSGTIGAGLMAYRTAELARVPRAILHAVRGGPPDPDEAITDLGRLSEVARREGMLALEGRLDEVDDDFLRGGLQLLVDGMDADEVRERLQIGLAAIDDRHRMPIDFLQGLADNAPTFGMIGTVIGLINMLGNLSTPDQLGRGMSVALLTTLYGVVFANLVFAPLASRLRRLNDQELAAREVVIDGVLALQAGLSPRLLVERLETFLAPDRRVGYSERVASERRSTADLREVA